MQEQKSIEDQFKFDLAFLKGKLRYQTGKTKPTGQKQQMALFLSLPIIIFPKTIAIMFVDSFPASSSMA